MTHFFYQLCVLSSFAIATKLNLPPLASLAWCLAVEKRSCDLRGLWRHKIPLQPGICPEVPSLGQYHHLWHTEGSLLWGTNKGWPSPRLSFPALLGPLHGWALTPGIKVWTCPGAKGTASRAGLGTLRAAAAPAQQQELHLSGSLAQQRANQT